MVKRAPVKLLVEGGGNHNDALKSECRKGFAKLLERAGFKGRMPRIIACGGRRAAYNDFCAELASGAGAVFLLVDAEAPVLRASPWQHVGEREGDKWAMPPDATDAHLHLMVQCMETWFLADRSALAKYFGNGFNQNALPLATTNVESVKMHDVFDHLKRATKDTKTKGAYDKGSHSFNVLEQLDPSLVRKASPWADRFFTTLDVALKP